MKEILDSPFLENTNDRHTKLSFKYAILNFLSFGMIVILEIFKLPLIIFLDSFSFDISYMLNGIIFLLLLSFLASGIINSYNAILSVNDKEPKSIKKIVGVFWGVVSTLILLWMIGLVLFRG